MKHFNLVLFSLLLIYPQYTAAQTVTMEDYFKQVRASHPFFKKEALTPKIARKAQERYLGDQDWVVRSNPYYTHKEFAKSGGFNPNGIDQASLNASIERTYWNSGGKLSLSYDYTASDLDADDIVIPLQGANIALPGDSGMFHENGLSITYTHPLMQNKDGALSRLDYEISGYDIKAADIAHIENQENFLLEVGDKFLDWVVLRERLAIAKSRRKLAKKELARTEKKRKQNLVDKVDVIRAKDAVINAEQNVLRVGASLTAKRAELASIASQKSLTGLAPEYDLYALERLPSIKSATVKMGRNSRLLTMYKVRLDQVERRRQGVEELSKPLLALNVSGGLSSGDDRYGSSHDYDKPQFTTGLIFSYPLGNRRAQADIARTNLEKERIREDMNSARLNLESALVNLMTQIKELEKVLALDKKRIDVAKEKTEAELKRYNQGRTELTFVIQSRDSERNAQLIHVNNAGVYHKLILRYRALMDWLLKSDS